MRKTLNRRTDQRPKKLKRQIGLELGQTISNNVQQDKNLLSQTILWLE